MCHSHAWEAGPGQVQHGLLPSFAHLTQEAPPQTGLLSSAATSAYHP